MSTAAKENPRPGCNRDEDQSDPILTMEAREVSHGEADERKKVKTFTSSKLDIQKAMLSDDRIPDGALRMALRVLHGVNEETGVAILGDETLADEIPRCSRSKCNRVRVLLEDLGWWQVEPGAGNRASVYRFSDKNVNAILDINIVLREQRKERRKQRRKELRDRWLERKRMKDETSGRRITDDTSTEHTEQGSEGGDVSAVTRLADLSSVTPLQGGRRPTGDTLERGGDVSPVNQNVSPVRRVHLTHTPSVGSLSGHNGTPVSSEDIDPDKIALPRPGSLTDAERIFLRYFGKANEDLTEYMRRDWLDLGDWVDRFARHGLRETEIKRIKTELAAVEYEIATGGL